MERTDAAARIRTAYGQMLLLALLGIPIGIAVGAVCALFGRVLLAITSFREAHPWQLIPFLAVAGIAVAAAYRRFGRGTERGMGLVFAVAHEDGGEDEIPLRLVPLIMVGTCSAGAPAAKGSPCRSAPPSRTAREGSSRSSTQGAYSWWRAWPPGSPGCSGRRWRPAPSPSRCSSRAGWSTVPSPQPSRRRFPRP